MMYALKDNEREKGDIEGWTLHYNANNVTVTLDCTSVVHAGTRHTSDVINVLALRYVKHPLNASSEC